MVRSMGRALSRWARASNDTALANARTAAVQGSRRALERAEVAAYLPVGDVGRGGDGERAGHVGVSAR